ncbi:Arf3-interacting protein 1, N-terminal domain protein [Kalmanozyma brasiliensis GHG001]|uniref:Arf3-interacting protein 1, N-terminal domain protein n=1 Tax=Kalmanozyma brasiliensis (strain GHG001) TaxID=1365824 RepID=UPI002867DE86|nr:Arf3-interacting protein 1, N-terminal domain protein [Kalmanozyma brasiliensis GHG001]EST05000.2 Arf3-interacting protein 1, N-terminal domain protein [Kalmanozyma brasiliensis GHG001]
MSIDDSASELAVASTAMSSNNGYCTFCLLAEFDIDRGSTLSHQYPAPTGYDEHMLAELMLPDGVHARTEDWTFFFLKPPGHKRAASSEGSDDAASSDPSSWLSDDLTYVINLVRTKHDNTVRRGALVKAMAIGTRYPFIEIFKPALLLALDDYFKEPGPDCLARLYDAINRLDLSAAPSFSRAEKLVLRGSDRRDLFEERFVPPPRIDSELASGSQSTLPAASNEQSETASSSSTVATAAEATRPRRDSTSTTASETKSLKNRLSAVSLRPPLGARRGSSATSINTAGGHDRRSNPNPTSPLPGTARPRDTHFFDTVLTYRNVPLPIRVPLTTFPEEVGEYSLIRLIQTFSGPQSTPTGPTHPHLHTNGPSTHPIIVLFNALVTQKRVIFLGYGQPANLVASFVLAACALGSGCGVVLQGFAARAFPYTNLLNLDDLEKVPGYIAGVTNPRFEDLRAWDVLLNVETGRIQVAKDIAPAPHPTSTPSQALLRSATLPRDGAGVSSSNNFGSVSSHGGTATPDLELAQFGALPTASSAAVSSGAASSKASSLGGPASRDRSNTSQSDSRSDPSNALFMEELQTAIAAHYGERFIRARVQEYVFFFVQRVTRHEEHFYGRTSLAPTCQPFLNGQLGSGPNYVDRDAEMREILSNQMRIEGFRSTIAYRLLVEQLNQHGGYTRAIRDFDVAHQIGRLRRARKLFAGEAELIYETIAKSVVTHDQIVEVLALLPPHTGGLLPLALGLFHPSPAARDAVVDFFLRLCRHPVGRKFVQSMHTYHRLAFARLAQDRAEAEMASAAKAEAQSVRSSTQTAPRTSSLPSSQIKDADSSNGDTRSPVDRNSASTTAAKSVDAELAAADGMEEPSYMSSLRGSNHPFKSFSPVRETAAS